MKVGNETIIICLMLSLISFNTNGLRNQSKFGKLLIKCKNNDMLCLQETNWTDHIMKDIKTKWTDMMYANHGTDKSCGVAILIKNNTVENLKEIYKDKKGRVIIIEFKYKKIEYRIINIYAPNIEADRKAFFLDLGKWCVGNCIIVGDFNLKSTRLDMARGKEFKNDASRKVFLKTMQEKQLIDVWRNENPNRREYSRRQMVMGELKQSRIDLCIAHQTMVKFIKNMVYKFTSFSDHAILSIEVGTGIERRGGGVWCLNSTLLEEEGYRNKIVACIENGKKNMDMCRNKGLWWERLKQKIRTISIRYAKVRAFKEREKIKCLKDELAEEAERIDKDPKHSIEKYIKVKSKLDVYEQNKCMGAITRSREKYAMKGERCTGYFLGLEKRKQERVYIEELENENGEIINDFVDIIGNVGTFYKNLYKKGNAKKEDINTVLGNIDKTITNDEKSMCDDNIKDIEIKESIMSLNTNKSPGTDGLTGEFYKTFIDNLLPILNIIYAEMEKEQEIPESLATGLITIIYKNKGSKRKLENYRPLTVLNTDYKILTKVLANRIKTAAPTIVAPTQAYGIPGRDISDIIRTIRDTIECMGKDGGIILSMDLNKAFDRVEHSFLFCTLEKFGFGQRIINWIKLLYKNARSRIKINGAITDPFPLERSVRQGCPLSAVLYSLTAESLAEMIKKDKEIEGIKLPNGGESKIQQYADDTTCMVKNMNSVKRIMGKMEIYGRAAGAKVNIDKTEIMYVGNINQKDCNIPFRVSNDYMKILGINMGVKEKEARDETWNGVINKVKNTLNAWKPRRLKLKGKVLVVNALILSQIVYALTVIDMPEWVHKELNSTITNYIWDGKLARIAQKTLIGKYEEGGLKLVDLNIKKKAIRIKTVKKYLYDRVDYGWKNVFKEYLYKNGRCEENGLIMIMKNSMYEKVPRYYKEVFDAWGKYRINIKYECTKYSQVINQPIWCNPLIKMNNNMLWDKKMFYSGLTQIKDCLYEFIPGFLRYQAIIDAVKEYDEEMNETTTVNMYDKIKESIPIDWVRQIENNVVIERKITFPELYIENNGEKRPLRDSKVKDYYKALIQKEFKEPASEKVWEKVFPGMEGNQIWKQWNVSKNSIECQDHDFKLRHNRLYTNVVIHQINKDVRRECDICKTDPETLMHLYYECDKLKIFFMKLKEFLQENWGKQYFEGKDWKKTFLFGVWEKKEKVNINMINYVLSHARYAVWLRRNLAHFEQKIISVWAYFVSGLKKDISLIFKYEKEEFQHFVKGCSFISVNDKGKLMYRIE